MTRRKKSHLWLLKVSPRSKSTFDELPASNKLTIFRRLRELLLADDPYTLPFVEMLQAKEFGRVRKFRAGNYRVLFILDPQPIVENDFTYKGRLFLVAIGDRKDVYK